MQLSEYEQISLPTSLAASPAHYQVDFLSYQHSPKNKQGSHSPTRKGEVIVELPKFNKPQNIKPRRFGRIGQAIKGPPLPDELRRSSLFENDSSHALMEGLLLNRRDHFLADITKPHRLFPLNMQGVNPLKNNPKASDKIDDIERTLKVSHVEEMPTKANNYYQELLKKVNRRKQSNGKLSQPQTKRGCETTLAGGQAPPMISFGDIIGKAGYRGGGTELGSASPTPHIVKSGINNQSSLVLGPQPQGKTEQNRSHTAMNQRVQFRFRADSELATPSGKPLSYFNNNSAMNSLVRDHNKPLEPIQAFKIQTEKLPLEMNSPAQETKASSKLSALQTSNMRGANAKEIAFRKILRTENINKDEMYQVLVGINMATIDHNERKRPTNQSNSNLNGQRSASFIDAIFGPSKSMRDFEVERNIIEDKLFQTLTNEKPSEVKLQFFMEKDKLKDSLNEYSALVQHQTLSKNLGKEQLLLQSFSPEQQLLNLIKKQEAEQQQKLQTDDNSGSKVDIIGNAFPGIRNGDGTPKLIPGLMHHFKRAGVNPTTAQQPYLNTPKLATMRRHAVSDEIAFNSKVEKPLNIANLSDRNNNIFSRGKLQQQQIEREIFLKRKARRLQSRGTSPKMSNLEKIDRLLEKKPITSFQGEMIYNMQDVQKLIDLMPKPVSEDANPFFMTGNNEAELDMWLLEEMKKTRPKKPFFQQGMGDKILFIGQMDRFQERQEKLKQMPSIEILRE